MTQRPPLDPRADELLCDEALDGLSPDETRALEALLGEHLDQERQAIGRATAAIDAAYTPRAPLPAALQERILTAAEPFIREVPAPTAAPPAAPPAAEGARVIRFDRGRLAAWLIAAACLAAALVAIVTRPPPPPPAQLVTVTVSVTVPTPPPPAPSAERERLQAAGSKAVRIPWTATKDPAAQGVAGDVVWSTTEQRGYMTFRGLPANDPSQSQYQLWIFDKNQDQRYPIDGGVFDVGPNGEVVVPITAKLHVSEPTLFAVTVEKPGGVVVSSRKRLVLAAPVPAG